MSRLLHEPKKVTDGGELVSLVAFLNITLEKTVTSAAPALTIFQEIVNALGTFTHDASDK